MECNHISRVVKWGLDSDSNFCVTLWGCTDCDEVSETKLVSSISDIEHTHSEYVDGCFACKVRTLQLTTGDANGNLVASGWTNKKWDGELKAYRDARAQGIQPASTKMKDIKKAVEASDKTGKAFQA